MKNEVPTPPHPTVDWATLRRGEDGKREVQVTCPWCNKTKWNPASEVANRIKKGTFTGFCYKDRLLQKERKDRKYPFLPHPQVNWSDTQVISVKGQRLTSVAVTCPDCSTVRYEPRSSVSAHIRNKRFTGRCRICSGMERKQEWAMLSPGRRIDPNKGYVRISRHAVSPDDKWLWDGLRQVSNVIMEHRLVMSKILGRPLTGQELVDHMDGNKLNNDPSNLRLYIRGRNMPGETSGYGTYYHEWQLALARIKELEEQLAAKT